MQDDMGKHDNTNENAYQLHYCQIFGMLRTHRPSNDPAMYVCLCNPVTDRQIRACATDGCGSFRDMACKLGVAQTCGRCASLAKELFEQARVSEWEASSATRVAG
jgi:bacterioferritin-associated ferredoxin